MNTPPIDTDEIAQTIAEVLYESKEWVEDVEADLDISGTPALSYVRIRTANGKTYCAVIFEGMFPPQGLYAFLKSERNPIHGPTNVNQPVHPNPNQDPLIT
jgi:hypothetical protein